MLDNAFIQGISKFQAAFRGQRARKLHIGRVEKNLVWAPYAASHPEAIRAMLDMAKITHKDVVVDIGSGDGRVVIAACKDYPAKKSIGIEFDPVLVAESRRHIHEEKLENRVEIIQDDWVNVNLDEASIVTLFFLPHPSISTYLKDKLKPGTKVVAYVFEIMEWKAKKIQSTIPFMNNTKNANVYLYEIESNKDSM